MTQSATDWCRIYASFGWKVLPLPSTSARFPAEEGWQLSDGLSPEEVTKHNIEGLAIQTGPISNLLVLDADNTEAIIAVRALLRGAVEECFIPIQKTRRGAHFLFAWPKDWPDQARACAGKLMPGVDVRGWHNQINACPSDNKNWIQGPFAPPPLPESIILRLTKKERDANDPTDVRLPIGQMSIIGAAIAKYPARYSDEQDGSSTLMTRTAHAIRGLHVYDEEDFLAVIQAWNAKRKDDAFDDETLRRAHADAMKSYLEEQGGKPPVAPLEIADTAHAGDRFAWHLQQEGEFVADLGALWQYNDGIGSWSEIQDRALHVRVLDQMKAYPTYGRGLTLEPVRARGIADIAKCRLDRPSFFDDAPRGIGVLNGFVELVNDRAVLRGRAPENRCRDVLPIDYTPGLIDEVWEDFLAGLFKGADDAKSRVARLQQFAGAMIFGLGPRFNKALVLYGEGSNGKSLWLDAVTELLPKHAITSVAPQAWEHEYQRYELRNALVNVVGELPARALLDGSHFKLIVEGGLINARRPRERVVTFRPRATNVFATNTLFQTGDLSHGFWRRFLTLTFPNRFEPDAAYAATVKSRPAAVLAWAVAGAESLIRAGGYIEADTATREEWERDSDSVRQFTEECTTAIEIAAAREWTCAQALYDLYVIWAKRRGITHLYALNGFAKQLSRLGTARKTVDGITRWALAPRIQAIN